ncbi:tail fiber domain-containing protein [Agrobacterium radiobacter]|uniref:tail fiber domain-containing protein n=1 Tax=Agrobacterium radiobacter TaxID=362 RepID=UPI00346717AD
MGKPKAPAAPDPKDTSAASTGTNIGTAVANAWMGNVNETTPDGSTRVDQTGTKTWTDTYTGKTYEIPTFSRTTTLSPQQQAIKDQQDAANLGLSTLGNKQTQFLQGYMSKPFDGSNEATEARLMELGRKRLDPALAQQDEALRTRLANQGIKAGSAAYDREMTNQNQSRNDAYNQLLLTGRQQAFTEAQATRNQPINEITALLSGGQVSQPNFMGANMPTIPTTDTAGIINQDYQNRLGAYNTQMAQRQGLLGGLFGLGSAAIKASDRRVKKDIKPVGELMGERIYSYRYKGKFDDGKHHIGVMAQNVEKHRPDAVMTGGDGVKRVHYGRLFGMSGAEAA